MKKEAAIWERVDALKPWTDNPRKNKGAIEHVAESIKRFGFASPIIARAEDKTIIAGHTRYEAAKKLGLDSVPVRYLDLDPADSRLLALADNKIGEIAEWDEEKLEKVMQELLEEGLSLNGLGWNEDELSKIVDELKQEEIEEDEVPEPDEEEEPDSKLGEVYELGEHRLICGDSTLSETWEKLMQGESADLCITDPPYGVSYQMNLTPEQAKKLHRRTDGLEVKNDEKTTEELESFLDSVFICVKEQLQDGRSVYVFSPPGIPMLAFTNSLSKMQLFQHSLVWNKDRFVMGRADYHYKHEIIFYGWKKGAAHYFIDDRTKDTVIDFTRPSVNKEHPTMKPIGLLCELINNSSKKDWIVIDAFGGSGSTLIAAAQTKRRARLVELDPKYCDVIRKRWTQYAKDNNLDVGTGGLE
jgi:DNA modification methylase